MATENGKNWLDEVPEIPPTLVTVEMAKELLEEVPDNPKPFRQREFDLLCRKAIAGEFDGPGSGTVIVGDQRGKKVVIEGRTRMKMIVATALPQWLRLEYRKDYAVTTLHVHELKRPSKSYMLQRSDWLVQMATVAYNFRTGGKMPPINMDLTTWCDRLEGLTLGMRKKGTPRVGTSAVKFAAAIATRETGTNAIDRYNSMFSGTMDRVTTDLYRTLQAQRDAKAKMDQSEIIMRAFAAFAAHGQVQLSAKDAKEKLRSALAKW